MEEKEIEQWKDMENAKKCRFNSEKIWKIWKKGLLNSEKNVINTEET